MERDRKRTSSPLKLHSSGGFKVFTAASKSVVLPEGATATNSVGLLFDRGILASLATELAEAVAGDLYATVFPNRRCVCLYGRNRWLELRSILARIPNDTLEQRKIRRITLGFEAKISQSEPFLIPITLASYGLLSGDDLLVVEGPEYMELWARDSYD